MSRLYLNVLSKNIYINNNNNKKIEKYFQKRSREPWETLFITEIKSVITFNTNRKKTYTIYTVFQPYLYSKKLKGSVYFITKVVL